ncbi:MAG: nitrile hydratase subunit beta, partial [Pseudomonadota bacterium]
MDGIHDLGGKHGHGPVVDMLPSDASEPEYVAFSEHWHAVVFSIINTLHRTGIAPNVDYFRHAVERIEPVNYLHDGYYGRWLGAAETILVEAGKLTQQDVSSRAHALGADPADPVAARPEKRADFAPDSRQARSARELARPPLFKLGDWVVTQAAAVAGHTRLPAYARGVRGCVVATHGGWVYPDHNAHGLGEDPQHLYTIQFAGTDL